MFVMSSEYLFGETQKIAKKSYAEKNIRRF